MMLTRRNVFKMYLHVCFCFVVDETCRKRSCKVCSVLAWEWKFSFERHPHYIDRCPRFPWSRRQDIPCHPNRSSCWKECEAVSLCCVAGLWCTCWPILFVGIYPEGEQLEGAFPWSRGMCLFAVLLYFLRSHVSILKGRFLFRFYAQDI